MAESINYGQHLIERVRACSLGTRTVSINDISDPLYETVKEMLKEKDPQFTIEIAEQLKAFVERCLLGRRGGLTNRLYVFSMQLGRTPTLVERAYGLHIKTLGDAIKLVHGEYDGVTYSLRRSSRKIGINNRIMYLSEDELKEFITTRTTRRQKVEIVCDF